MQREFLQKATKGTSCESEASQKINIRLGSFMKEFLIFCKKNTIPLKFCMKVNKSNERGKEKKIQTVLLSVHVNMKCN